MPFPFLESLADWIGRSGGAWLAALIGVVILLGLFLRGGRLTLDFAGALAIIFLLASWFSRHETIEPVIQRFLFGVFASVAIAGGVMLVMQRNPVYAALFFAVAVLGVVGLFVLSAAPFLAAATIIVYAGAIIVTFLFVIMLAQQSGLTSYDQHYWQPIPAAIVGGVLFATLLTVINKYYHSSSSISPILVRLEQLEGELTHAGYEADNAKPPRLLGKGLDDLLIEEANSLPETAAGDKARQVVADSANTWKEKWTAKPTMAMTAEEAASGRRRSGQTLSSPGTPIFGLGTKSAELMIAVKKLSAAARVVALAKKETAVIAKPAVGNRQRLHIEKSNLSYVTIYDTSLVRVLGRTLWGDYLIGVELAGTLLVIGAIGAVAINTRRQERTA